MANTDAYDRFIASMKIGYQEWHDGTPYDLEALDQVSPSERLQLEQRLLARKDEDWRDVEALARINTPAAIAGLKDSLNGPIREVRIRAARLLFERGYLESLDSVIVEGLRNGSVGRGLAECEMLAAEHPSPAVMRELLYGVACSMDDRAVRFAALLFFLCGKAESPFDRRRREFFLRFNSKNPAERRRLFDQLCKTLGLDGSGIQC